MDLQRFEHLLASYGADFSKWPADERGSATLFASQNAEMAATLLAEARSLDAALDTLGGVPDHQLLERRILAAAPRAVGGVFNLRAALALAACAVFGTLLGYGGGRLAPLADSDTAYFTAAFQAPLGDEG